MFWNSLPSTVPIPDIVDRAYGPPTSMPFWFNWERQSLRPTTRIRSTRTWTNWRPGALNFATISFGLAEKSSPTTRKPSSAAPTATTWSRSSASGSLN